MFEVNDIKANIKVIDFGTSAIFKPKEVLRDVIGSVITTSIIDILYSTRSIGG